MANEEAPGPKWRLVALRTWPNGQQELGAVFPEDENGWLTPLSAEERARLLEPASR
jgi:hypothetical protein